MIWPGPDAVTDSGYIIAVGLGAPSPVHHEAVSGDGTR